MFDLTILLIPILGLTYLFVKYFTDQSKTFNEYLEPELRKYGFILISSTFYKPKFMDIPFDTHEEDIIINPIGGKFSVAPTHVHRHLRKVMFKKQDGKKCEVIAAIEFKSVSSKEFKRVRWKPDLSFFT